MQDLDAVKVLLVEDNPHDADLTIRALKRKNIANQLHVVSDGAEALDYLFCRGVYSERNIENEPKVILLDLKLPKVSGLEVLRQIKADSRTKTIPVVVVTSSGENPDIEKAYHLGANSYVVKPIEFDNFSTVMADLGYYWLMINRPLT